jgi:hypothetical protein
VSPGATPEAFTFSLFVEAPVAPNAIVTVPVATECDWLVVLVKVAYAPNPTSNNANSTRSNDNSTLDRARRGNVRRRTAMPTVNIRLSLSDQTHLSVSPERGNSTGFREAAASERHHGANWW